MMVTPNSEDVELHFICYNLITSCIKLLRKTNKLLLLFLIYIRFMFKCLELEDITSMNGLPR